MFRSPGSTALDLGPLQIHWYGVVIGVGILLCYWYVTAELKRRKLDQKPVDDMAFWLVLSGILGARLYFVIFNFSYFLSHPVEILQIWKGGLAIHGAILGGAAAYTFFVIRKKISWFTYLDVITPGVLLAQSLGRWGNFFNSEAFGRPTELPWRLFIPFENRPRGYEEFEYFHPTFLYESLWNFAGFLFLIWLSRHLFPGQAGRTRPSGLIFCSYLVCSSFGRFFIESLRMDSLMLGPMRAAQMMSIVLFTAGILGLILLWRRSTIQKV